MKTPGLTIATLAVLTAAVPAQAKPAMCSVGLGEHLSDGPCDITLGRGGSFRLTRFRSRALKLRAISVMVVRPGFATYRLQWSNGFEDQRGELRASSGFPGCWDGEGVVMICVQY